MRTLLASPEPSIRWKARVHLLHVDSESARIQALQEEIRRSPRVRALLSRKKELCRRVSDGVYLKWQGIQWILAHLADIGYPSGDESLAAMRDRVLDFWLRPVFYEEFEAHTLQEAYRRWGVPLIDGRYRRCASQQGNALYFLHVLGLADPRTDRLAERLLRWQWPDGGWNCDRHPSANTSSFMETLLPMVGLALHAKRRRSSRAREASARASEVFLRRQLFRRESNGQVIHKEFVMLHYPLYWHYDFLAGLKALVAVGRIRDPRCAPALELLEEKRLENGGWPAERRFYTVNEGRWAARADYVDWGGTGASRMNEWVTADALSVLRAAGRLEL